MMRARSLLACLCLLVAVLSADPAAADRRVALVIGNSAYTNAPKLANTVADAVGLAQLFRNAGFETVILRKDLGVMDFRRAVRDFLVTAEGADIAVVYYAGHGIEIGGMNYLVPVDAKLSRDYDVDDEAVPLDRIVWPLQSVKRLRLILLDACRDNPFPDRMRSAGVRALESRGLVKPIDVGADTLVAYAAKAGSKSYDGDGPNSPYATALLRHLAEPGVDIRITLGRVRDDVLAMTGGRQEPFIYGSLGGATIPLVPLPTAEIESLPAPLPAPQPAPLPPAVAAAKAMLPTAPERSPQPAEAVDPSQACIRDEQRLMRLRAAPAPDQIVKFVKELACERLREQVQRLLESVGVEPAVAAAKALPPTAPERSPQPAATEPLLAPLPPAVAAAKAMLPTSPERAPRAAEAVDPSLACSRDEQRLERLRVELIPDQIVRFEKELACERLRPQVQRLRESVGVEPPVAAAAKDSAPQQPVETGYREACVRENERLQRLRAEPNSDEIRKFERELSCEQIRLQVQRLCDSVCR